MIGMERIDANKKRIGDMKVGDTFTETGRYDPESTKVYMIGHIDNESGLVIANDMSGWGRAYYLDEIVYPI